VKTCCNATETLCDLSHGKKEYALMLIVEVFHKLTKLSNFANLKNLAASGFDPPSGKLGYGPSSLPLRQAAVMLVIKQFITIENFTNGFN